MCLECDILYVVMMCSYSIAIVCFYVYIYMEYGVCMYACACMHVHVCMCMCACVHMYVLF